VSVQESEFKDVIFDINQTPEHLTINISDENHRKYRLQIVDIQGKSMYESSLLYSLENVVGLSEFAQGSYVYRILCGNVLVRSGKFVVTR
ncbi:MAG: T9SS type A sorting domain-containing protein, partial [Chlorobi bacterium]|nr:T9SS type A sorting domain-containing protein [Chlorobiota bacterium]